MYGEAKWFRSLRNNLVGYCYFFLSFVWSYVNTIIVTMFRGRHYWVKVLRCQAAICFSYNSPSDVPIPRIATKRLDISWDKLLTAPDSKVHGANMGPIWGRQDPGGPHVGPMNFAIWDSISGDYVLWRLRITGTLLWECTSHRWILLTKGQWHGASLF